MTPSTPLQPRTDLVEPVDQARPAKANVVSHDEYEAWEFASLGLVVVAYAVDKVFYASLGGPRPPADELLAR